MSKLYFYILCIYVFIIPQYNVLEHDNVNLYDIMVYFFIFISALQLFYLLTTYNYLSSLNKDKSFILLIIFMLFSAFSYYWNQAEDPGIQVNLIIKILITIIPIMLMKFNQNQIQIILKIYFIGSFLGSIQVIYNYYFVAEYLWGIKRSYITGIDSNESAILLAIGYSLSLYYFFRLKKYLYLVASASIVIAIFYTASRTGFIAIIISTLIYLFILKLLKFNIPTVLLIFSFLGLFFVLPMVIPADNLMRILNAGSDLEAGEMSGREVIWAQAFEMIPKKWISGYGMNSFSNLSIENAHNVFIKAQFELGILGSLTIVLWVFFSVRKLIAVVNDYKPLLINIFSIIFISFLQLSWTYSINIMVLLTLILTINNINFNEDIEIDKEEQKI